MNDNPFADDQSAAFMDPSITAAANDYATSVTIAEENYVAQDSAYGGDYSSSYTSTAPASSTNNNTDWEDKEAELRAQIDELEKEKLLSSRTSNKAGEGAIANTHIKAKNWPSRCYPIVYHSINDEIPERHRKLARQFYATLIFTWVTLGMNWITWIWIASAGAMADGATSEALWSTLYLVLGIPGGWKLWYMPIYSSLKGNSSMSWCCFFMMFAGHLCFCAMMAIGIPGVSGAGLVIMIEVFGRNYIAAGLLTLACAIFWFMLTITSLYLIKQTHVLWRSRGGAEDLQRDVQTGITKAAVANAAKQHGFGE